MTAPKTLLNIPLSPLGFGCYALGGAYGNKLTDTESIHLLCRAFELGFRLFDTSSSYGDTEGLLAIALGGYRHDISLVTKVGLSQKHGRDLSAQHVLSSCEASLRNLRTDYIDLYQVHFDDPTTPVEQTVQALERLKESGKIRHYGIGHLPLPAVLSFMDVGKPSSVMMELSPLATSRYREFDHMSQQKLDVIAFSITGRGILSGTYSSARTHDSQDIRRLDPLFRRAKLDLGLKLSRSLKGIGQKYGMTPAQVAIRWVVEQPGVAVALTGPTRYEHLEENWLALQLSMDKVDKDLVGELVARHDQDLASTVAQDVSAILYGPLAATFPEAQADLVYVLEYGSEERILESAQSMELFRDTLRASDMNELISVYRDLREIWDHRAEMQASGIH